MVAGVLVFFQSPRSGKGFFRRKNLRWMFMTVFMAISMIVGVMVMRMRLGELVVLVRMRMGAAVRIAGVMRVAVIRAVKSA
jgi:hypothetical protein